MKFKAEETKNGVQSEAALELFYIDSRFAMSSDDHLMESQEGIEYYLILCSRSLHSGFRRALPTAMQALAESSLPSANTSISSDQLYVARSCAALLAVPFDPVRHHFLCYLPTYHLPSGKPYLITIARCLAASDEEEPAPESKRLARSQPNSRGSNHESSSTWKVSRPSSA